VVAYDGTEFAGFQRQRAARTVQGELEAVLERLYGRRLTVHGAGRTDAGVHARGQVIACYAPATIPPPRLAVAANGLLPGDVALRGSEQAPAGFDPRRHAVRRVYRYRLAQDRLRDPLRDRYVTRVEPGLDLAAMAQAAEALLGEHDFRSFCCVEKQDDCGTVRGLERVAFEVDGPRVTVEWAARSFLRKQVRCMMGALLAVGRGKFDPSIMAQMLAGQPWPPSMAVAPPQGLTLERVEY